MSSIIGCLPSTVVFHQRLSCINSRLPSKVVVHQRLSSIKGRLPSKVIFHQRLSSIKGCLPSKVVFHQRVSSIKGCLTSKIVFYQIFILGVFLYWLLLYSEVVKIPTPSTQPQPNITLVGLDMKMTLHIPPTHSPTPHKLNVSNISVVSDQILMKL